MIAGEIEVSRKKKGGRGERRGGKEREREEREREREIIRDSIENL